MPLFATDIPEVVVKPSKMLNYWSSKIKYLAMLVALAGYVYFLIYIKAIYVKNQKLNSIKAVASETEKMMRNLHIMDSRLATNLELLNVRYND